jgi:hypothetical protein
LASETERVAVDLGRDRAKHSKAQLTLDVCHTNIIS